MHSENSCVLVFVRDQSEILRCALIPDYSVFFCAVINETFRNYIRELCCVILNIVIYILISCDVTLSLALCADNYCEISVILKTKVICIKSVQNGPNKIYTARYGINRGCRTPECDRDASRGGDIFPTEYTNVNGEKEFTRCI